MENKMKTQQEVDSACAVTVYASPDKTDKTVGVACVIAMACFAAMVIAGWIQ